ncbi:hypothetical protein [Anaeroselena agilis]|uniref:Uncharacterized protein n=1 Tax=Anaeroselena agilis TaxID=3063788 RepID=A0ABU3NXR2_9FIRM|nr:hypothetical protein [Selenomonadales bacterium 4137-cl]
MAKDKDKTKFTKDEQNLSAIIADHNPLVKSDEDEQWTKARGYQTTND